MKTPVRFTIGLCLAGCGAVLLIALRTDAPPSLAAGHKRQPRIMASPARRPLAANTKPQPVETDKEPLLPPPVIPAESPAVFQLPNAAFPGRPAEESLMSSWAARDPEGAGHWLNQNRSHPKFADMVRGYAIQIAAIDPAAARQWAAVLDGNGNRFRHGATLEQHIDAIEAMLQGPAEPATSPTQQLAAAFLPDYTPALVRQHPDEAPVIEMKPVDPFV